MRAVVTLVIAVAVGLLAAGALMWQLGMDVPAPGHLLAWLRPNADMEEKFARFGRGGDVVGAYASLGQLDTSTLYRLRATDGLCQSPAFDCRGLSRASVSALIDGILKQRDESTTKISLGVSCVSAAISLAGLLGKSRTG